MMLAAVLAAGCATASKDITTAYVSPMQYQGYSCEQIGLESQRIHSRVNQLGGRLDEAASNDKTITGVGVILFWPALFALGGTKGQEAEYARLKGEYEALQQAAVTKNCMTKSAVQEPTNVIHAPAKKTNQEIEVELTRLKKLKDDGLITSDVYAERQKAIITN